MRQEDPSSHRIIDLWTFRSTKSNKRYIVEVEGFEDEFFGLKFYWKDVENSKHRYMGHRTKGIGEGRTKNGVIGLNDR